MTARSFVFICTDQQRSDSLGCYGNRQVRSPHIDAIARRGMRFDRHITPMQICSPSRATMVTGRFPRHHGLAVNGMALPARVPTLPGILADHGYRTHGVGKQHLQPLLAPAEHRMPDSRAFWSRPGSADWNGPYYGYQTLDLLLGESDTAHLAGHYANWLRKESPEAWKLLLPDSARIPPPEDLDEIWCCALPVELHYNSWITARSVDFIRSMAAGDGPFFLFVSYPDPHHPFDPPVDYARRYDPAGMPLPVVTEQERSGIPAYCRDLYPRVQGFRESYWSGDQGVEAGSTILTDSISDDSLRRAIAYTHAMVEMIDDGVGRIMQELSDAGFADRTNVFFTSDHGEYLGDHGLLHKGPASYRQLTEVSMLMCGPGIGPGRSDALTSHIDLAPTILELAGLPDAMPDADGVSMIPLLAGVAGREFNFGEYHPTVKKDLYNQTVQDRTWRLTRYPEHPHWGELFNLEEDPRECVNLFDSPGHREIVRELSEVLAEAFPPCPGVDNTVLCKW